jgi:DNA anti-recombination protein RmuC
MGKVFVMLVRQTETQLLEMGQPVLPMAQAAQEYLHDATHLSADQRARLDTQLTTALQAHHRIAHQSRRLTQGKSLPHCKILTFPLYS